MILGSGHGVAWDHVFGDTKPEESATSNFIYRSTTQPVDGKNGDWWYNSNNRLLKVMVSNTWIIFGNYITDTNMITDGALLGQKALWSYVSGPNKPADNADVTAQNQALSIFNQGAFATLDKLTASNQATYIANLIVEGAWIKDATIVSAKIGYLQVADINIANGSVSSFQGISSWNYLNITYARTLLTFVLDVPGLNNEAGGTTSTPATVSLSANISFRMSLSDAGMYTNDGNRIPCYAKLYLMRGSRAIAETVIHETQMDWGGDVHYTNAAISYMDSNLTRDINGNYYALTPGRHYYYLTIAPFDIGTGYINVRHSHITAQVFKK